MITEDDHVPGRNFAHVRERAETAEARNAKLQVRLAHEMARSHGLNPSDGVGALLVEKFLETHGEDDFVEMPADSFATFAADYGLTAGGTYEHLLKTANDEETN